jgi:DNA invertase Pin-like site-specific DNA recombinase
MAMIRAYAYVCLSGRGRENALAQQLEGILEYAATHNIEVINIYREVVASNAADLVERPAWAQLMTSLHSSAVRSVLIERLDCLARDLITQEIFIASLRRQGFELVSVHEPDLKAKDRRRTMVRQLLGAVEKSEKSQFVLKLRGARLRKKAATGRCEGRKPFGFYAGEHAIVERMKALRSEGLGFDRIAARLNDAGVPTRTGKPWHGVVVNRILTGKR